ncbi:MAG: translation initiation factor IF-2 [Firmicutes bacterium]|nr:translation initiation factor IF-2 [Bacillota bacterium]
MSKAQQETAKKDGTSLENIKLLNSMLSKDGSVSTVLTEIKALKRKTGDILAAKKEILYSKNAEVLVKTKTDIPLPSNPPIEKKVGSILPIIPKIPAQQNVQPSTEKKTIAAIIEPSPKTAEKPIAVPSKPVMPKVEANNSEPKPEEKPAQKYVPSYIRGIAPPPKPPIQQSLNRGNFPFPRSGDSRSSRPPHAHQGARPPYQGKPGTPQGARPPARPHAAGGPNQWQRPFGGLPGKPPSSTNPSLRGIAKTAPPPIAQKTRLPEKKKEYRPDDRKTPHNKRTLIRKGYIIENTEEGRMGSRKLKTKKNADHIAHISKAVEKAIITTENLTVKILSEKIGKTAQEIIKQLMLLGIMTTINSVVDFETMELVANELGIELELKLEQTKESLLEVQHEEVDDEKDLIKRPPVIAVMGHVDHGKTSLLDAIRKTNVILGEAGGITQHIGAYSVMSGNEKITFLDTPGHEAFTSLRARGARVTDIAVLVVAADDGVMPQTIEAIDHAKAANVPILVAINKMDKPGANIDKIKQELSVHNLVSEEWGGDTIMVPISAKKGEGIDKLLEMILFLAEYNNYRANPKRNAKGLIIEAKLDKGKGPIANIIVQNGTLKTGNFVVSGMTFGRVRAMVDERGKNIKEAPPSTPVSILGFSDVPGAGDGIFVVDDEKMAKQVIEERIVKMRNEQANMGRKASLDELMDKVKEGLLKELNIIIKADVQGSTDALKLSLSRLSNPEVKVRVIHAGVGAISQSDIMLAGVSNALIIGFNIKPDADCKKLAEKEGIEIRAYNIIYEAIDDVERAIKGMIAPKYKEVIEGRAQVRNVFKITGSGAIAGSYVLNGKIIRGHKARIYRAGELVHEGVINGLKRFKEDVKEISNNFECGISVSDYTVIKVDDEIECYTMEIIPT